jgi:tetratricopeptide (TPR) repeat protein
MLRLRSAAAPVSTSSLQLALTLVVGDRIRDALAQDPVNVSHWSLLGDSYWNMVGALRLTAPLPGDNWEPVRGLLPAQAAFCYRRALELNPSEPNAQRALSNAFEALRLSDAKRSSHAPMQRARPIDRVNNTSEATGATDPWPPQHPFEDEPMIGWESDGADGLSRAVFALLRDGRAESAARLFAEAENRGIRAAWTTSDRVATALLLLGRPADARRIWERTKDPPSPAARLAHIAASELAALDFTAAENSYRAALALDPGFGEIWLGLALLHTQRGDPVAALTDSREGLRRTLTPEQRSFLQTLESLATPYAPRS